MNHLLYLLVSVFMKLNKIWYKDVSAIGIFSSDTKGKCMEFYLLFIKHHKSDMPFFINTSTVFIGAVHSSTVYKHQHQGQTFAAYIHSIITGSPTHIKLNKKVIAS